MYALISQLTLVCNMQLNVLEDLAEAMKAWDEKKKYLCGFCWVFRPRFVLFRCFSAGEAQIWPGDLRVSIKEFHIFCIFFYRFSHCQD